MTTMPPEMSSTATANVVIPPTSVQRESMSSLHASRSRFMITDILAGSAAAAAAAIRNGSPPSSNSPTRAGGISAHMHLHQQQQHHHQLQQQQQQQQHAALQHYLAQQQHLLQQHQQQQQQQQQHLYHGSPPPTAAVAASAQQHHHHQHHHQQQQHSLQASHSLHPQLPTAAPAHLIGFPAGAHNGLHAVQAAQAAHYAALQQERERLREMDAAASAAGLDGHEDRSRSPHPVIGVRDLSSAPTHGGPGGAGGGGGGGSSVSGDQASTIDDSDSDTCGAKDDDGNSSIKSDNLMGLSKKQRKARTAFTDHQLQTLEKSFERQKYLSVQDRMELANKLELSDCQVKTWYQNRRTKWKRQTAVGLELLAEAGNYAAFQRLYGGSPYLGAWPYAAAQSPHGAPPSAIDLYYRQAAAAAALQKPLSYRMYPSVPPMGGMAGMAGMPVGAAAPMPHLTASNSLSSLSSYYQSNAPPLSQSLSNNNNLLAHSPVQSELSDKQRHSVDLQRTPSPQLNPGSPPERAADNSSCPALSDDDADAGDGCEQLQQQQQQQQDPQDEEDAIEV